MQFTLLRLDPLPEHAASLQRHDTHKQLSRTAAPRAKPTAEAMKADGASPGGIAAGSPRTRPGSALATTATSTANTKRPALTSEHLKPGEGSRIETGTQHTLRPMSFMRNSKIWMAPCSSPTIYRPSWSLSQLCKHQYLVQSSHSAKPITIGLVTGIQTCLNGFNEGLEQVLELLHVEARAAHNATQKK